MRFDRWLRCFWQFRLSVLQAVWARGFPVFCAGISKLCRHSVTKCASFGVRNGLPVCRAPSFATFLHAASSSMDAGPRVRLRSCLSALSHKNNVSFRPFFVPAFKPSSGHQRPPFCLSIRAWTSLRRKRQTLRGPVPIGWAGISPARASSRTRLRLRQRNSAARSGPTKYSIDLEALLDCELEARHQRSIERRFKLSRLQSKPSIDSFHPVYLLRRDALSSIRCYTSELSRRCSACLSLMLSLAGR